MVKKLGEQLSAINILTVADDKGYVYIDKMENPEKYCDLLLDLAVELNDYMYQFAQKIKNGELKSDEISETTDFLSSLLDFFKSFYFFHGKSQQTWIDMVFLFFGISVYFKAYLRIIPKTIELFLLSQTFEDMEKTIYNKMYYELTDFLY